MSIQSLQIFRDIVVVLRTHSVDYEQRMDLWSKLLLIKDECGENIVAYVVRVNNLQILQYFIERGANLSEKQTFGSTYLHMAVKNPDIGILKCLIDSGIDVNATDYFGRTALHVVASCFHPQTWNCIDYLIYKGANPHAVDDEGSNCLHYGALRKCKSEHEFYDFIKTFRKHGVDVNLKNNSGQTALFWALKVKNAAYLSDLLDNGADPEIPDFEYLAEHFTVENEKFRHLLLSANLKSKSSVEEEAIVICDVCEDMPIKVALVPCGHTMCSDCLYRVYPVPVCPFCQNSKKEMVLVKL